MNLYEKLIEVRKSVPYLQKSTDGYQYKYVSGSDTLAPIVGKMNELGLLLIPQVTNGSVQILENRRLVKGDITMKWINAEKPEETLEVPFLLFGEQSDASKAFGTALTYSERYFLLKFFNIPTDKDDPDAFQKKISKKINGEKSDGKQSKSELLKDLEDDKNFDEKCKLLDKIKEILKPYNDKSIDKILLRVFKKDNYKSILSKSVDEIKEGGNKIFKMLKVPVNLQIMKGDLDRNLIDPTADPITDGNKVTYMDKFKEFFPKATEYKEKITKLTGGDNSPYYEVLKFGIEGVSYEKMNQVENKHFVEILTKWGNMVKALEKVEKAENIEQ